VPNAVTVVQDEILASRDAIAPVSNCVEPDRAGRTRGYSACPKVHQDAVHRLRRIFGMTDDAQLIHIAKYGPNPGMREDVLASMEQACNGDDHLPGFVPRAGLHDP
jgi:hypothetical protein